MKPKLKVICNRLVLIGERPDPLALAKERFGKPWPWEAGSTWKPRGVPFLTAWMQSRGK